ncbi:MAG: polysaccharide biosynthesis/export family protein [Bacteroidota bacterium]
MKIPVARINISLYLSGLLLVLFPACTPQLLFQKQEGQQLTDQVTLADLEEHILQQEDKITISIWGHEELGVGSQFSVYSSTLEQGKYISINARGEVTLPLVGTVEIAGLTVREADLYLRKLYSKYVHNPIIYLRILDHRVTILGEVRNPGNYSLDRQQKSLIEVIGDAGGLTDFADADAIIIVRHTETGGKKEIKVDLTLMETLYTQDLSLHSRDIIYVPERRAKQFERTVSGKVVPVVGALASIALILSILNNQ